MRASVLTLDMLVHVPAVLIYVSRRWEGRGRRTKAVAALSVLLQPALILIDNGHFQYNSVMLGLALAAFAMLYTSLPNPDTITPGAPAIGAKAQEPGKTGKASRGKITSLSRRLSYDYVIAAVCFSLSLGFKQMALYYAPAIFALMLGRCYGLSRVGFDRG